MDARVARRRRGHTYGGGAERPEAGERVQSGVPHGGDAYWRLNRAHLNCLENLPLFATVVLVATVAGMRVPLLDTLACVYLGARVGQSITHVSSGSVMAVNVRFTFFLVQVGCLVMYLITIARGG